MIQSGFGLVDLRKWATGLSRRSKAVLRSWAFWYGMSIEDSDWGGRFGTWGKGRGIRLMREEREGGILGSLERFLGVERKEICWPFEAKRLERWWKGMRWPMASHGNMTI